MKLHWPTPKSTSEYRRQAWKAAPVIVVQQADDGIEYLLAKPNGSKWLIEEFGFWQPEPEEPNPPTNANGIWTRFFASGLAKLTADGVSTSGRKLLLCLKRPVIEFHRLDLLRVEGLDLTEQVHNQVAVQERLDPDAMIVDYACEALESRESCSTFVSCLARETWLEWQTAWRAHKLQPLMMVPRAWATWQLLRQQATMANEPTLVVALYRKQADLIVLDRRRPIYIRSLNLQQPDEAEGVAQQMISEIRLTASTVDLPGESQSLSKLVIFGDREFAETVANQLQDSLEITTEVVALESLPDISYRDDQALDINSAPMLGLLFGLTETPSLESIDLMNPKQIVQPASRWRIYGWLAALTLLGLGYFAFDLWQTYAATQQELVEQGTENKEAEANLNRMTPKARVAEFLQRWEVEQVNWLQQLDEITKSLPSGDDVVVRQYDGKRTANGAEITLQIQAKSLETVALIEQAVQKNGWKLQFPRQVETRDPNYPIRLDATISYSQEP
jgi:hypothetical protein